MDPVSHSQDLMIPVVLLMTALAAVEDLIRRKVSNALLVSILLPGLFYQTWVLGGDSLLNGLLQGGGVLAVLFPLFLMRVVGAGDIKLYASISAFLGLNTTAWIFLYSLYAGGILGLGIITVRFFQKSGFNQTQALAAIQGDATRTQLRGRVCMPFAPSIFFGTCTVTTSNGDLSQLLHFLLPGV